MDRTQISEADEGKRVVDFEGKKIGRTGDVRNGGAYVDPAPGTTDSIGSRLGWGDADEDDYRSEPRRIERTTDDAVYLEK